MIRFSVIGTNWITEQFLQAASKHPDFHLQAVYSRTLERAEEFARLHGAEEVYTDVGEMAGSPLVDAVYIASPNSFHAGHAIAFLEQGKHVLCEKPLASNAAEAKRMIALAERHQVVLMEAMKPTLVPNFAAIQENLGRVGKIRRYFASYCQYSSRYDAYKQGTVLNAFKRELSNGALMDIGIYCVYPLVVLFGKPESIKASGLLLDTGVDAEGSILLKYPDMEAVIIYSKITDSMLPLEIQGEDGNIIADKVNVPEKVVFRKRNGEELELTRNQEIPPMYYETAEFIRLIKEGKRQSTVNSHEHSLAVLEILDECRRQMGVFYSADNRS